MAVRRAISIRALQCVVPKQPVTRWHVQIPQVRQQNISRSHQLPAYSQVRFHSAPSNAPRVLDFNTVKQLSDSPSPDRVIIDVREPSEYQEGYIPGAINIPIKSQPDGIFLPAEEFEERFSVEKPKQEQELIFYCKAGVRSSAASQLAQQAGYARISDYRGSWLDWQKNGGPISKP